MAFLTPSLPTPDLPLLRKVLDHIDAHPDEWDQRWFTADADFREWFRRDTAHANRYIDLPATCGTTRCIAGWIQFWGTGSVNEATAAIYAREALGLTLDEAHELFFSTASEPTRVYQRVAIQRVAERIARRAGERL